MNFEHEKPGLVPGKEVYGHGLFPPVEKGIAFSEWNAYNIRESDDSQRVFRHPHPKCEALMAARG